MTRLFTKKCQLYKHHHGFKMWNITDFISLQSLKIIPLTNEKLKKIGVYFIVYHCWYLLKVSGNTLIHIPLIRRKILSCEKPFSLWFMLCLRLGAERYMTYLILLRKYMMSLTQVRVVKQAIMFLLEILTSISNTVSYGIHMAFIGVRN